MKQKKIWILGAELGRDFLKVSSFMEGREEIYSENYILPDSYQAEAVISRLEEYFGSQETGPDFQQKVVFSGAEGERARMNAVAHALSQYGYEQKDIRIISRENAYIHYVLNQKEEIRKYTVLLFDFDGQDLFCYRLSHSRKKLPEQYKAEKKHLGSFTLHGDSSVWGKMFDERFAVLCRQIFSKEVVGAVYLTGSGFEGGWLNKSLRILCDGRRAFLGQNLFSAGCCYYGRAMTEGTLSSLLVQAPETVLYDAGVLDGAKDDCFTPVISSGCAWYEAKGSLEFIPERSGKVDVIFINTATQEKQVESVDVSGLLARPRKTGRLRLTIEFFSSTTGVIMVRDLGFGGFYPSTNQVFLHKFTLL